MLVVMAAAAANAGGAGSCQRWGGVAVAAVDAAGCGGPVIGA